MSSTSPNDFNARIIEQFRANGGQVGEPFQDTPLLLLHHTGARTGTARVNPVAYLADGNRYVIFASKAGAPTNPDWYHNLRANPEVEVEFGDERFSAVATPVEGSERDRIYAEQAKAFPGFADYEKATDRVIPVIELRRT